MENILDYDSGSKRDDKSISFIHSFIIHKFKHLPSNSNFSSRLASRLSRRSCLSISWLMRFCSFASSDKQHSIILMQFWGLLLDAQLYYDLCLLFCNIPWISLFFLNFSVCFISTDYYYYYFLFIIFLWFAQTAQRDFVITYHFRILIFLFQRFFSCFHTNFYSRGRSFSPFN